MFLSKYATMGIRSWVWSCCCGHERPIAFKWKYTFIEKKLGLSSSSPYSWNWITCKQQVNTEKELLCAERAVQEWVSGKVLSLRLNHDATDRSNLQLRSQTNPSCPQFQSPSKGKVPVCRQRKPHQKCLRTKASWGTRTLQSHAGFCEPINNLLQFY